MWNFKKIKVVNEAESFYTDVVKSALAGPNAVRLIISEHDDYYLVDELDKSTIILISDDKIILSNEKKNIHVSSFVGLSFTEKLKRMIDAKNKDDAEYLKELLKKNEINIINQFNEFI